MLVRLTTNAKIGKFFRVTGEVIDIEKVRPEDIKEIGKPVIKPVLNKIQCWRKCRKRNFRWNESLWHKTPILLYHEYHTSSLKQKVASTYGPIDGLGKMKKKEVIELIVKLRGY